MRPTLTWSNTLRLQAMQAHRYIAANASSIDATDGLLVNIT
jgi:hypothetical protein